MQAADLRRPVRHTFWKRLKCMAFFPEAGSDLSALPGANRGADQDMIRCRRDVLAEVRLLGWQAASVPSQPSLPRGIHPMADWLTSVACDRAKPNLWIELRGLSLLFA
jgi:hypothetical protein